MKRGDGCQIFFENREAQKLRECVRARYKQSHHQEEHFRASNHRETVDGTRPQRDRRKSLLRKIAGSASIEELLVKEGGVGGTTTESRRNFSLYFRLGGDKSSSNSNNGG